MFFRVRHSFVDLLYVCRLTALSVPPSFSSYHRQRYWRTTLLALAHLRTHCACQPALLNGWLADWLHGCIQLFFCVCICLLVDGYLFAQNLCIVLSASLSLDWLWLPPWLIVVYDCVMMLYWISAVIPSAEPIISCKAVLALPTHSSDKQPRSQPQS